MVAYQDITIFAGSTFQRTISLNDANNNPLNVSGYVANACIARDHDSNTIIQFETMLLNGSVTLRLEANVTATMSPGYYQYDVIIGNNTNVYRVIEGIAQIEAGIAQII